MPNNPKVATILITTRNRPDQLRLALESIRAKDYRNVDVLVVDDASTEETAAMLRDFAKLARVRRIERAGGYRRNPGPVINVGHLLSETDIVLEQCGEMCHLTDCVSPLIDACRPGVVALARVHHGSLAQMRAVEKDMRLDRYEFPPNFEPETIVTDGGKQPGVKVGSSQTLLYCGRERPVPFLFLGAIHQTDFKMVGGYDEKRPDRADEDLADRLLARGTRFIFVGKAVAFHLQHVKM